MDDAFLLGAVIMFLLGGVVWFAKLQKYPAKPAGASAPPPRQAMAAEH